MCDCRGAIVLNRNAFCRPKQNNRRCTLLRSATVTEAKLGNVGICIQLFT